MGIAYYIQTYNKDPQNSIGNYLDPYSRGSYSANSQTSTGLQWCWIQDLQAEHPNVQQHQTWRCQKKPSKTRKTVTKNPRSLAKSRHDPTESPTQRALAAGRLEFAAHLVAAPGSVAKVKLESRSWVAYTSPRPIAL